MELREWAIRILSAHTLEEKLLSPAELTDLNPGEPLYWNEPSRPPHLGFKPFQRKDKLPSFQEHHCEEHRARCLHRFAGHELLAVEIMAFALLAFPNSPPAFRRGLVRTLKEEQHHVDLYLERLKEMKVSFGEFPLYRHFWSYTPSLTTPLKYISLMSLTFEMANLDFAPLYKQSFTRHGDLKSAALMHQIYVDELTHVGFGFGWLKRLKEPSLSDWEAWKEALPPRFAIEHAKGSIFFEQHRYEAKVSEEWVKAFKDALSHTALDNQRS